MNQIGSDDTNKQSELSLLFIYFAFFVMHDCIMQNILNINISKLSCVELIYVFIYTNVYPVSNNNKTLKPPQTSRVRRLLSVFNFVKGAVSQLLVHCNNSSLFARGSKF